MNLLFAEALDIRAALGFAVPAASAVALLLLAVSLLAIGALALRL